MQAQCPTITAAEQAEATTATLFLDTQLLRMLDSVEPELRQEFTQVVLVGDGMDTRPFRWVSSQQGPSGMPAPGIGLRGVQWPVAAMLNVCVTFYKIPRAAWQLNGAVNGCFKSSHADVKDSAAKGRNPCSIWRFWPVALPGTPDAAGCSALGARGTSLWQM